MQNRLLFHYLRVSKRFIFCLDAASATSTLLRLILPFGQSDGRYVHILLVVYKFIVKIYYWQVLLYFYMLNIEIYEAHFLHIISCTLAWIFIDVLFVVYVLKLNLAVVYKLISKDGKIFVDYHIK